MAETFYPEKLPLKDIDWVSHIPLIGRSNAALAKYEGIVQGILNPEILLSPFITEEAILSSRIEGTVTTLEEILASESYSGKEMSDARKADIQEVKNYLKAIRSAETELKDKPLYMPAIKSLHRTLPEGVRGRNKEPGVVRSWQNWIGPYGCSMNEAAYVPPPPALVWEYLNNWEDYMDSTEKDPIVQIAVLKGQFELIHPFSDGNGRIGRMLIPLLMYRNNLISRPFFYISGYFDKNRDEYYSCLPGLSKNNDWDRWIEFFLRAVEYQANQYSGKAQKIIALYSVMKSEIPQLLNSKYSVQAIDAIFSRPIFTPKDFSQDTKIPYDSGLKIIRKLEEESFISLRKEGRGQTPSVYEFSELIEITKSHNQIRQDVNDFSRG